MRVLADESCDGAVVTGLRDAGHDVIAVAEWCPGATDAEVISMARSDGRVLVTEDKDFGQLVFAAGAGHSGVVLLRYPFGVAPIMAERLGGILAELGPSASERFVVLRPDGARIVQTPPSS